MPVTIIRYVTPPVREAHGVRGSKWGATLRACREQAQLSQRQLAQITGVNRSVLRRIENGELPGSIDVLERIAHALGYEFELMLLPPLEAD